MHKPYRQNASIIAKKDGKFLLVKKPRIHHAWQFPQGGVEGDESYAEAALREFEEEIGCNKIEKLEEVSVYCYDWNEQLEYDDLDERLKKFRGQKVHLFTANFTGSDDDITLDTDELAEWKWVAEAELRELIESPEYLAKILEIITK